MTLTIQPSPEKDGAQVSTPTDKLPGAQFFRDLHIGRKLIIGFGILVLLTFLGAGVSYLGSQQATTKINTTDDVYVPTALLTSYAQADLLRLSDLVYGAEVASF